MNIYVSATELENLGWSNVTPDLVKNLNSFLAMGDNDSKKNTNFSWPS